MTAIAVAPDEAAINTALRSFLLAVLPDGTDVVLGQVNRVAQPQGANHVVFTPTARRRLATNIDDAADCAFTGSVAGGVLTVTDLGLGAIVPGRLLFGTGVIDGTRITAQNGGTPGGAGTYAVDKPQSVGSEEMAAGAKTIMQETEVSVQIDVHGPSSSSNAQVITTLMRDSFGTEFFAALNVSVAPLHADDPKQIPFVDAEQQWEDRWVVQALLQANVVLSVPQQYADSLDVPAVSVDATYPP